MEPIARQLIEAVGREPLDVGDVSQAVTWRLRPSS